MGELILVRHGQASFGAANYDVLSERGHAQALALGKMLAAQNGPPDLLARGAQRRHRETLEGIAAGFGLPADEALVLDGLNEFDFGGLLAARFPDPAEVASAKRDPQTYFRTLKETVLAWQQDEIVGPPERFGEFTVRIGAARDRLLAHGAERVLVATSGGPIAWLTTTAVGAPVGEMIRLQMQIKNASVTRLVHGREGRTSLHTFNETPHIDLATAAELLTYH